MNIIFLDVDGVLNTTSTTIKYNGITGIDPIKVKFLKEIVHLTNSKIVIISSWIENTELYNYLSNQLSLEGLSIYDSIDTHISDRSISINNWINQNNPSSYIILDDTISYYKDTHLKKNLMKISKRTGLQPTHIIPLKKLVSDKKQKNTESLIPWIFQNDIEYPFGFSRAAFDITKRNNVSKVFICLKLSPKIEQSNDGLICKTISDVKNISLLCKNIGLSPTFAFYLPIFSASPKIVIPKNHKAMHDLLSVLANSKREFITIFDFNELFLNKRNDFLIGENILDYTHCPYKYRPFPFIDKNYSGNTKDYDFYNEERYDEEFAIKNYDFFFSISSSLDYKRQFFFECAKHQIPFIDCISLSKKTLQHTLIQHSADEITKHLLTNGETYVNYTLYESPQQLLSNIKNYRISSLIKTIEQDFI